MTYVTNDDDMILYNMTTCCVVVRIGIPGKLSKVKDVKNSLKPEGVMEIYVNKEQFEEINRKLYNL